MPVYLLHCSFCGRNVYRDQRRIQEGKKFGWKVFCSNKCLGLSRLKRKEFICANPNCNKKFSRNPSDSLKSKCYYCSLRCAALVNNKKYPRDHGAIIKICAYCFSKFIGRDKYCSRKCKDFAHVVTKEEIVDYIKEFDKKNGRIPYKNEYKHSHAARFRFGTWNKAIKAAGFIPNPVMFANKHIAKDGHKCDSLAEKIIDDWLFARKIEHERSLVYPGNQGFKVDFKIKDYWIEFFGLAGDYKWYDELKKRKVKLANKYGLKLIELYPKDLFPTNNLSSKLDF